MDYLSHIIHNRVVPPIEKPIELHCFVSDHLDSLGQVCHVLLKFILHLFRPDGLMDVSLEVDLLSIIFLHVLELKVVHCLKVVVLLVQLVPKGLIAGV